MEAKQFDGYMMSDDTSKLFEALALAQGAMSNAKKDSANPYFNSSYSTLASVLDAIREPFAKNGLAILQPIGEIGVDGRITVTTILSHKSGQFCQSTIKMPIVGKNNRLTPQDVGSAITYARRYSLSALVGISQADDDDDGNKASSAIEINKGQQRQPMRDHEKESAEGSANLKILLGMISRKGYNPEEFIKVVNQKQIDELTNGDVERDIMYFDNVKDSACNYFEQYLKAKAEAEKQTAKK